LKIKQRLGKYSPEVGKPPFSQSVAKVSPPPTTKFISRCPTADVDAAGWLAVELSFNVDKSFLDLILAGVIVEMLW
jgi:hypothetical protein